MKAEKQKTETFKAVRYLSPALISIIIFTLLPIAYTIYIAFTNKTLFITSDQVEIVGFDNFVNVLSGPFKDVFFPVFLWTIVFALI